MPKYSQPFELVLFHIINLNIKCHKGSRYPHLLNNHLFNYLNLSGLTVSSFLFETSMLSSMLICLVALCLSSSMVSMESTYNVSKNFLGLRLTMGEWMTIVGCRSGIFNDSFAKQTMYYLSDSLSPCTIDEVKLVTIVL